MNRRKFINGAGVALIATVAGCTSDSDDEEYEPGNGGDSSTSGNGNGTGNGNSDNDSDSGNGLEITEHDLVVEEGEYMTDVTIEGIVENTGDERVDYAEVSARVYDNEGNQLESYMSNTTDLDAGATWAFEIMVIEEPDEIGEYDISVSDSAL